MQVDRLPHDQMQFSVLSDLRLRAGVDDDTAFPRCSEVAGWLNRRARSLGELGSGVVAAITLLHVVLKNLCALSSRKTIIIVATRVLAVTTPDDVLCNVA